MVLQLVATCFELTHILPCHYLYVLFHLLKAQSVVVFYGGLLWQQNCSLLCPFIDWISFRIMTVSFDFSEKISLQLKFIVHFALNNWLKVNCRFVVSPTRVMKQLPEDHKNLSVQEPPEPHSCRWLVLVENHSCQVASY